MIGGGQKSAIGLTSMDSANITAVSFQNITIHGEKIATPLFLKLGNRAEGEDGKGTALSGSISTILTILSGMHVCIYRCRALSPPERTWNWPIWC